MLRDQAPYHDNPLPRPYASNLDAHSEFRPLELSQLLWGLTALQCRDLHIYYAVVRRCIAILKVRQIGRRERAGRRCWCNQAIREGSHAQSYGVVEEADIEGDEAAGGGPVATLRGS